MTEKHICSGVTWEDVFRIAGEINEIIQRGNTYISEFNIYGDRYYIRITKVFVDMNGTIWGAIDTKYVELPIVDNGKLCVSLSGRTLYDDEHNEVGPMIQFTNEPYPWRAQQ